jgi:lichenan operon transcriptional antiterminator
LKGERSVVLVVRFTRILEFLTAKGQATEQQLSQLIKTSHQTLKSVIDQLNKTLQDVAYISHDKKVYHLHVSDFDELALLLRGGLKATVDFNSSEKRLAYICKRLIDTEDYVLIDDMADELSISRGTIQKDLKKLTQLVKKYDCLLDSRPNRGVKLIAREVTKRLLFINHVYDYYQYELRFDGEFFEVLDDLYETLHLNLTQVTMLEREILFAISRIKKGHLIEEKMTYYINFAEDNAIVNDFFVKIEAKLARNLTQYERDFMAYPLNMNNNFSFDSSKIDKHFLNTLIYQMRQDICEAYPIYMNWEQLLEALGYHLIFLLNRTVFHYQEKNIFFKSILNRYPFAFQLAEIAQKSIQKLTGLLISDLELNTLAIYFELSLSKVRMDYVKKIALVADVGARVKNLMFDQIQMMFGASIAIERFTEENAGQTFSEFLAVFTTIPLKKIAPDVIEIQVSNLLDPDEELMISHKIRKIKVSNMLRQEDIELDFMILEKTYQENLAFMIENLEKSAQVDKGFAKRIIERNDKSSTIFDECIAFPHAINSQSDKIILHVAVIPHQQIQLIFLLAVPEHLTKESESDLIKVYDMIFEIIGNEALRQEILQTLTLEQFCGLFKRKGMVV